MHAVTLTTLLLLVTRKDLPKTWLPLVAGLLVLSRLDDVFLHLLALFVAVGPWSTLAFKLLHTAALAATTYIVYTASLSRAKRS